VSFTTTSALRSSPVTDSSGTSTLLREGLPSGTSNITRCLDTLPDSPALVFEILEDVVDDVSSQRLVEILTIESDYLV